MLVTMESKLIHRLVTFVHRRLCRRNVPYSPLSFSPALLLYVYRTLLQQGKCLIICQSLWPLPVSPRMKQQQNTCFQISQQISHRSLQNSQTLWAFFFFFSIISGLFQKDPNKNIPEHVRDQPVRGQKRHTSKRSMLCRPLPLPLQSHKVLLKVNSSKLNRNLS